MVEWLQPAVYVLCFATSLVCVVLLARSYRRTRVPLLLWVGLCFAGLAGNNFFLLLDLIFFPTVDLLAVRQLAQLAALGVLLYGFIWKAD